RPDQRRPAGAVPPAHRPRGLAAGPPAAGRRRRRRRRDPARTRRRPLGHVRRRPRRRPPLRRLRRPVRPARRAARPLAGPGRGPIAVGLRAAYRERAGLAAEADAARKELAGLAEASPANYQVIWTTFRALMYADRPAEALKVLESTADHQGVVPRFDLLCQQG